MGGKEYHSCGITTTKDLFFLIANLASARSSTCSRSDDPQETSHEPALAEEVKSPVRSGIQPVNKEVLQLSVARSIFHEPFVIFVFKLYVNQWPSHVLTAINSISEFKEWKEDNS